MKMKIRVAKEIRTNHCSLTAFAVSNDFSESQIHAKENFCTSLNYWLRLVQTFSLACVCDSEKSVETANAVRAIVCDSEKSRFHSVCKAGLSVREVQII